MDTWIPGRRPVKDLDFLGLGSLSEAEAAIKNLCNVDGADGFTIVGVETTWEETPSPGLRYQIGPEPFQIDIATGDPMVVPPYRISVDGVSVLCCAPEIMYGWKTHGLFERGEGRWRARDLWDLYLLQNHLTLDPEILDQAVQTAFSSRNASYAIAQRFFEAEWGCSKGSQKKWSKFCLEAGPQANVVEDLLIIKQAVAEKLMSIMHKNSVIAAVVRRDERYLVCQRPPHKRHGGLWEFPGGKIEKGETLRDAAHRELSEELNLTVSGIGAVQFSAIDAASGFLIKFVEVEVSGDPVLIEHTDLRWLSAAELMQMPLAPSDSQFVDFLNNSKVC